MGGEWEERQAWRKARRGVARRGRREGKRGDGGRKDGVVRKIEEGDIGELTRFGGDVLVVLALVPQRAMPAGLEC